MDCGRDVQVVVPEVPVGMDGESEVTVMKSRWMGAARAGLVVVVVAWSCSTLVWVWPLRSALVRERWESGGAILGAVVEEFGNDLAEMLESTGMVV